LHERFECECCLAHSLSINSSVVSETNLVSQLTRAKVIWQKGDIARLIMTSSTVHSCFVDIFYHIRQVAARFATFVREIHLVPHFGGRGGCRRSAMVPLERAMVVSYRLSIVNIALSLTIRPQFSIEYLRHLNQQGWVPLSQSFWTFPLE